MFNLAIAATALLLAAQSPALPRADLRVDHLASARAALAIGAFDEARREFAAAAAFDRDAGRVPTEAAIGLAHCLYSQGYNREAATVLDALAQEAYVAGDADTEARARLDAAWLHLDAGDRALARAHAERLRALLPDPRLDESTRKAVRARLG